MAQVFNRLEVDVRTETPDIITAVQNDSNSRFLDVFLFDNGSSINLTGHEVRIYGKKADGKEIYNNGVITEATNGRCQFELTDQALAVAQDLEMQIVIYYNNVQILQSLPFKIKVVKSLISAGAIPSSNEYGALVVLFQELYEAKDLMTTMVQNQGNKGAISTDRNINTFWESMEYVSQYLDTDLTNLLNAVLAEANVQGVIDRLGNTADTGATETTGTVMGKLNKIYHNVNTGEITIDQKKLAPILFRDNSKLVRVGMSKSFTRVYMDKIEGNNIFATGGSPQSFKLKIDKETLDILGHHNDAYYDSGVSGMCDDADHTYYFSSGLYKYSRITGGVVGQSPTYSGSLTGNKYSAMDGEYVYVSVLDSNVPKVLKYNKNTMTLVTAYTVDTHGTIFVETKNIYISKETDREVLSVYNRSFYKLGVLDATSFETNADARKVLHVYEYNNLAHVLYMPHFTNELLIGKFNVDTQRYSSKTTIYPSSDRFTDTHNLLRDYRLSAIHCHNNLVAFVDPYLVKVFVFDMEKAQGTNMGDMIASALIIDDTTHGYVTSGTSVLPNYDVRNLLFDGVNIYLTLDSYLVSTGSANSFRVDSRIIHFKLIDNPTYKTTEFLEVI